MGSRPMATEDDVSSDEWFARYLLDAVLLVVLVLTAIGIALYLDGDEYLRDWSKEPGAGFLACMVLCPALGVVTLGLAMYAGIRLFRRPRTLGHAFVRLTLLVAHVSVFLVCADTISSTATALVGSVRQSSAATGPDGGLESSRWPGLLRFARWRTRGHAGRLVFFAPLWYGLAGVGDSRSWDEFTMSPGERRRSLRPGLAGPAAKIFALFWVFR